MRQLGARKAVSQLIISRVRPSPGLISWDVATEPPPRPGRPAPPAPHRGLHERDKRRRKCRLFAMNPSRIFVSRDCMTAARACMHAFSSGAKPEVTDRAGQPPEANLFAETVHHIRQETRSAGATLYVDNLG